MPGIVLYGLHLSSLISVTIPHADTLYLTITKGKEIKDSLQTANPTSHTHKVKLHNQRDDYVSATAEFSNPRYSHTHAPHSNSLSYSQIHSYSLPPPSHFLSPLRKKKTERNKITGSDTWYGYLTSKLKTEGVRTLMKT